MSERDDHLFHDFLSPLKTLLDSLKIFLRNKQIFLSIFLLTIFPLSLLLLSLSLSSHPIRSHIYHLESVASLVPTRAEFRHVFEESRRDAVSLLRLRFLFFLPTYLFSLLASVTAVHSTVLAFNGKRATYHSALTAVKQTWVRLLVTTICVYATLIGYLLIPYTISALIGSPALRLLVLVIGSVLEVYLIGILSLAIVVSVAEDRFGWEAIRVGANLMKGRKVCGCALTGLFVLTAGCIAWAAEGLIDGEDYWLVETSTVVRRVVMGMGDKVGLICLNGMVILWGYVVNTVFYCECRRKNVIRSENDDDHILLTA